MLTLSCEVYPGPLEDISIEVEWPLLWGSMPNQGALRALCMAAGGLTADPEAWWENIWEAAARLRVLQEAEV